MLFNSIIFFEFFAVVYLLYRLLPFKGQNWMLLGAGYIFYGCWDIRFLFLIAFSTTVDFSIGLLLGTGTMNARQRRTAAAFMLGAAFFFLCINWSALDFAGQRVDWAGLMQLRQQGLMVLAGTLVLILPAGRLIAGLRGVPQDRRRQILIACSVAVNLAFLGIFKYFNFFVDSLSLLLHRFGIEATSLHLAIILPVGISFYTFQSLSYTIDVYRRRIPAVVDFWNFALFVAYFPPMVAGPIERAKHLLPQLLRARTIRLAQSTDGVVLVLMGLFKKVAIADGLAPAVASVFDSAGAVAANDVAVATLLFAVQILCDFSGYSDIARGVSKLLGIELMLNFNLPYFAQNPSDFWRRWHISLSTWLRDYLYIPLGGNRKGNVRTYGNLFLTMLLGGLWHGAAWNYVLWGAYQGALLCGHRLFAGGDAARPRATTAPVRGVDSLHAVFSSAWRIALFFPFCCYGWLLFRAHSGTQIVSFTRLLLHIDHGLDAMVMSKPTTSALLGIMVLLVYQFADFASGTLESFRRWYPSLQGAYYAIVTFVLIMGTSNAPVQFIYFQF